MANRRRKKCVVTNEERLFFIPRRSGHTIYKLAWSTDVCSSDPVGDGEATALANDSDYGLCGSVWTADPEHGAAVAAQVRTGVVAVNSSMILAFNAPVRAAQQSAIGRGLCPYGIHPHPGHPPTIPPAEGRHGA